MPSKKTFTDSDSAVERFFINSPKDDPKEQTENAAETPDPPIVNPPAVEKSRRKERIGLLLDARLKEDLAHLSKATGSKSLNDFLVSLLTAYSESPESQEKLAQYRRLLQN